MTRLYDILTSMASFVGQGWTSTPGPVQTILIAAFGTLVGAWLTSRSQEKRRVVDELKAIHAAYALCFTITNKAMAIKKQHIRPMKQHYDDVVSAFDAHAANPFIPLVLDLDLRTLSQPRFASETLERIVFEKCSLEHRGLAALVSVKDATDDLKQSIDYRNNLIADFKKYSSPTRTETEKIHTYVGAYAHDIVDLRFGDNIEALVRQVDDCIFFSMLLANELLTRERKLHARNWWKYRLNIPRQFPADWSLAKQNDLIPDNSKYADWLQGFKRPPSIWKRLWDRFCVWYWRRSPALTTDLPP
jgi:hypothetical protein